MNTRVIRRLIVSIGAIALLLSGCSTSDFTRVKTTGGYLSETKVALPGNTP